MPEIERHDLNYLSRNRFLRPFYNKHITDPALLQELWRQEVLWLRQLVEQHDEGKGGGDFVGVPTGGGGGGGDENPPYVPPEYCAASPLAPLSFSGTIGPTEVVRKSFTTTGSLNISAFLRATASPFINGTANIKLYDTNGTTLLKEVEANGVYASNFSDAVLEYTVAGAGTYYVDVTVTNDNLQTTPYKLVITRGATDRLDNTGKGLWRGIYVPSTQRIFVLSTWQNTEIAYIKCYNAVTLAIVNSVQLADPASGTYTNVNPILFYNPTDNSVWVSRRYNDDTNPQFIRINATTGVITETFNITLGAEPAAITDGEYNPNSNKLYGINRLNSTVYSVFNCATRVFDSQLTGPDYRTTPPTFCYNSDDHSIHITNSSNSSDPPKLATISSAGVISTVSLAQYCNIQNNHAFYYSGKIWTSRVSGGTRTLVYITLADHVITDVFTVGNIKLDSVNFDFCRNCINILCLDNISEFPGGTHNDTSYVLQLDRDSLLLVGGIQVAETTSFPIPTNEAHGELVWVNDQSRSFVVTGNYLQVI